MKLQNWPRPFAELIFSTLGNAFCVENTTFRSSAISPKFHHMMRLHEKDSPTSPNAAPATKSGIPKSLIVALATKMTLQLHQILHLPWKMIVMSHDWSSSHIWNGIYIVESNRSYLPMSPTIAPARKWRSKLRKKFAKKTAEVSFDSTMIRTWTGRLAPVRSSRLFLALWRFIFVRQKYNISHSGHLPEFHQTFKYCACHKINTPTSPNCTCHDKQHCNIIKCCPCYQKWHSSITKCWACHEK